MLQRQPGGPCSWAVRRASHSLPIQNATKNPCPLLVGQGFDTHERQLCQPALPASLRIPFAAARHTDVTTTAGWPLLMGRPARFVLSPNLKRNKEPLPSTRGAGVRRSCAAALAAGTAGHCQPALPAGFTRWNLLRMAGMAICTNTANSRMEPLMVSLMRASSPREEMILSMMV